jgi:hypothetical protein
MAKQYAVLHTEKGKGTGGGLGNHIDRKLGMEHTFQHADPARLHLNIDYTAKRYKHLTVPECIDKRIKEGYKGTRKIRSDAVRYLSTVLTGSHDQMKKIFSSNKSANEWIRDQWKFVCEEFGKENIVRFVLHLDEKTPHIHCVHVPLTPDGKLSAKRVMGGRMDLKGRQDRYAQAMEKHGLQRGESKRGVYHETAHEYYRRINITEDFVQNLDVNGMFGLKVDKTLSNTKNALKTALMDLERLNLEMERNKGEVESLKKKSKATEKTLSDYKKAYPRLKKEIEQLKSRLISVARSEDAYKKLQKEVQSYGSQQKRGRGI